VFPPCPRGRQEPQGQRGSRGPASLPAWAVRGPRSSRVASKSPLRGDCRVPQADLASPPCTPGPAVIPHPSGSKAHTRLGVPAPPAFISGRLPGRARQRHVILLGFPWPGGGFGQWVRQGPPGRNWKRGPAPQDRQQQPSAGPANKSPAPGARTGPAGAAGGWGRGGSGPAEMGEGILSSRPATSGGPLEAVPGITGPASPGRSGHPASRARQGWTDRTGSCLVLA